MLSAVYPLENIVDISMFIIIYVESYREQTALDYFVFYTSHNSRSRTMGKDSYCSYSIMSGLRGHRLQRLDCLG